MKKRFTDSEKWTMNKWFRNLTAEDKLFWFYIHDMVDSVGVWEVDIEQAEFHTKCEYAEDHLLSIFGEKIHQLDKGRKWWIKDFVKLQYTKINENPEPHSPHRSYKKLLIEHGLWEIYIESCDKQSTGSQVPLDSHKEKEEEKVKVKEEEKVINKETEAEEDSTLRQSSISIQDKMDRLKGESGYKNIPCIKDALNKS